MMHTKDYENGLKSVRQDGARPSNPDIVNVRIPEKVVWVGILMVQGTLDNAVAFQNMDGKYLPTRDSR